MFAGASNTLITGGTFSVHNQEKLESFKLLRDNVAPGAFHNSGERYDPPRCHPGTREIIIQEIMKWIETIDKEAFILWLYGPAGSGKSAIAQTIAELCHEAGLLAASFFFSRTAAGRNDATFLIPTLAYQLVEFNPEILEHISSAVEKDSLIFKRSLGTQLEVLILEPLSKVPLCQNPANGASKWHLLPRLIIIDGLDECADAHTQHYLLMALASSLRRYPVPLIFMIASRPEQEIRDVFNRDWINSLTNRLVLDDRYQPDVDIRRFLDANFAEIKKNHILGPRLPPSWPSKAEIRRLVRKSSGQFIYASTVIKFVQSPRHRPTERLDIIFGLQTPRNQAPFVELDALYSFIFASVDDIEAVLDVFRLLLLLKSSPEFPKDKISVVEAFWDHQPGDLQVILADMHSVLSVPLSEDGKLRIYHASLGDFLVDRSRSARFFIDSPEAHTRMAKYCVKHTSTLLERMSIDGESTNEVHLDISCECFMPECLSACPTEGLLHELRSFRLDKCFALPRIYVGIPIWDITRSNLPQFFAWLQQQCNPNHIEGCLCESYMAILDNHLLETLSRYPSSEPFQYLLTAFALDSCLIGYHDFSKIFSHYTPGFNTVGFGNLDDELLSLGRIIGHLDFSKYRSMLSAFLNDRDRSGSYYRDDSKYTDLAIKMLGYLCHQGPLAQYTPAKYPATAQCALSIVLDILSRFPRDPEVVKFLRGSSIRQDVEQREVLVSAMEAYIQDYDLSKSCDPDTPKGLNWGWMLGGWFK